MTPPSAARVDLRGTVDLVVPDDVDDPRRPSGGNVYDLELGAALVDLGWAVRWHRAPDSGAGRSRAAALAEVLGRLPDGAVVLVDGLLATGAEDVLTAERRRLALVPLVHLPASLEDDRADALVRERQVLDAAAAVLTTSAWSQRWLTVRHAIAAERVVVATPGVHPAGLARLSEDGASLTCVAAVLPAKGHDVLVHALASLRDLRWSCRLVGPLERDPDFVACLRTSLRDSGIDDRVHLVGPVGRAGVDGVLATTDVLVLPTRLEVYGMVATEALAHGVPVLASAVGGVPEALGRTSTGELPGLLVPPGDAPALAGALRRWLTEPDLRRLLRAAAAARRSALGRWSETAGTVDDVLRQVAVNQPAPRAVVTR